MNPGRRGLLKGKEQRAPTARRARNVNQRVEQRMDGYAGEPSLDELLADPTLHLMMEADGCDMAQLAAIIGNAAGAATVSSMTARDKRDASWDPARAKPGFEWLGPVR
jgi:hypothetical protein